MVRLVIWDTIVTIMTSLQCSALRPKENGWHFANYIFKLIFLYGSCCIWINVSLKVVLKDAISYKLALVQIMAWSRTRNKPSHYSDVIMGPMAFLITSLMIVYSTVYSGVDQRKHQSSASLAFVRGIHRGLVNSPHKWPVTQKMFPFDDVIIIWTTDGSVDWHIYVSWPGRVNTLRLRQNGHHFADDILKCIFSNENIQILMKISLKFVPEGHNVPALV